jgi:enamine deaminase RidA (YjgF/YER057c/UK114 family)/GNAT superfamily N-acetyltransferase
MTRRLIDSGSTFEDKIGYSRAVVAGDWIFVSGTTGFDYATMSIADGVLEQAEQCLSNIDAALRKAGASLQDVVRVTYVLPDAADFEPCWPILRRYFGHVRPAAMMIAAGLADPRMKIEIEVTALKGSACAPARTGIAVHPVAIATYDDGRHRLQVIELWKEVFGYDTPHNRPDLSIDRKLAVGDGLFFVAIRDDRVVGTVLAGYDGHRGWLYSVAVHPASRKSGIGIALVGHAERALIERGCVKINLQIVAANQAVAAFYRKLGYVVEERISMGKRIARNVTGPG